MQEPIIAKIAKECAEFMPLVKNVKKAKGITNQDIADATGVPLSNISKFFSGNLSNPSIYNAVAVCKYLGISLDDAFGLQKDEADQAELHRLKAENADLKKELDFCRKMIAVHEASVESARNAFQKEHHIIEEMLKQVTNNAK